LLGGGNDDNRVDVSSRDLVDVIMTMVGMVHVKKWLFVGREQQLLTEL
jgi:hypothetical protein